MIGDAPRPATSSLNVNSVNSVDLIDSVSEAFSADAGASTGDIVVTALIIATAVFSSVLVLYARRL